LGRLTTDGHRLTEIRREKKEIYFNHGKHGKTRKRREFKPLMRKVLRVKG